MLHVHACACACRCMYFVPMLHVDHMYMHMQDHEDIRSAGSDKVGCVGFAWEYSKSVCMEISVPSPPPPLPLLLLPSPSSSSPPPPPPPPPHLQIREIECLDHLSHLRVLNLAGNNITCVSGLARLQALAELNLRRNRITNVVSGGGGRGLYCRIIAFCLHSMKWMFWLTSRGSSSAIT